MSLFSGPEEHAANPPESWRVVKVLPRLRLLTTAGGVVLESITTKRAAEALRREGFLVNLYEKERRWYAGEQVPQWRPYAEIVAERERREARLAEAGAVKVRHDALVAALDPSHSYCCEHPACDEARKLTWRTESSERYCAEHFPWNDLAERRAALVVVGDAPVQ